MTKDNLDMITELKLKEEITVIDYSVDLIRYVIMI